MIKVRCPICERLMHGQGPKEWPQWPFCSPRCKVIDLGRWLGGSYRLESPLEDDSDEDLSEPRKPAVPSADPNREEA